MANSTLISRKRAWWRVGLYSIPIMVFLWWTYVPVHYEFDAVNAKTRAEFGWTAPGDFIGRARSEQLTLTSRRRTASVRLPGLAPYNEPYLADISLDNEGNALSSFSLVSHALTRDEVLERINYWASAWKIKLDPKAIDDWRHGDISGPFIPVARFDRSPGALDVWLEIRPAGLEMFAVMLKLYWHPIKIGNAAGVKR